MAFDLPISASTLLISFLCYTLLKYAYRVTLHPLSPFPGPPLARFTRLYAAFIDCTQPQTGTCVVKQLPKWHAKYGPIVRVRPDELHIHDWDAYCQVFKAGTKFDKDPSFYNNPVVDGSFLNVTNTREVKAHKDLFQTQFSKRKVEELEPLMHEKLEYFLKKLDAKEEVNISNGYMALAADTVMHWAYQDTFHCLDEEDFESRILRDIEEMSPLVPPMWYWPTFMGLLMGVISKLSPAMKRAYFPAVAVFDNIVLMCGRRIDTLMKDSPSSSTVSQSIFSTALRPNAEKRRTSLTHQQLVGDAVLMFLAGSDTTSNTLSWGTWHLLRKPEMLAKLQAELDSAMSEPDKIYSVSTLEKLPYLRAVMKESLRMSMGTSARLMRVVPREGAVFCGKRISPGTRVSFSHYVYNYDPAIFEEPHEFKPERWMVDDIHELETKMVSFSRGSRGCIGINVAHQELLVIFAHVFRRYQMSNSGTTDHELSWTDGYTPTRNGALKVKLQRRS